MGLLSRAEWFHCIWYILDAKKVSNYLGSYGEMSMLVHILDSHLNDWVLTTDTYYEVDVLLVRKIHYFALYSIFRTQLRI